MPVADLAHALEVAVLRRNAASRVLQWLEDDGRHLVIQLAGDLSKQPAGIYEEEYVYDGSELQLYAQRQYMTTTAKAEHLFFETPSCRG